MLNRIKTETILTNLIKLIPPLSIAVVVIGLVSLSIILKRPDYLLRGQYLAFPIILACLMIIYYKPKNLQHGETIKIHLPINRWNYHLIYLLLYLVTIYLLIAYQTRPIIYFLLIGIMAVLILTEILASNYINKPASILFKITLLAANLIFGQTLKLPLYYGCTDILPHLRYIESLLSKQHITAGLGSYQYFPFYHIFNAIGQLLTNLDLHVAYFIFISLAFLTSICFIYLITYKVSDSLTISLATSLIYSMSSETLYSGMNMVTRVMSCVIFLTIFYLLISKKSGDIRKNLISILLIISLVFLHQVTLVHEVIILFVFIILELIIYHSNKLISFVFPLLFAVSFISYWIYIAGPFFDNIIKTVFSTSEVAVVSSSIPIPIYKTIFGNLETSIIAFFSIFGIIILLIKGLEQKERGKLGVLFALFSFLAMPLFFPGPASFFEPLLLSSRISELILPFFIVPIVEGILFFLKRSDTKTQNIRRMSFIFITVFTFTLTTTLTLGNSTDLNLNKFLETSGRKYFKQSELSSFNFCSKKIKEATIYTDLPAKRYLDYFTQLNSSSSNDPLKNPSTAVNNYFLLRNDLLIEKGELTFIEGKAGFMSVQKKYTSKDFCEKRISGYLGKQNKIFENNTGSLYNLY